MYALVNDQLYRYINSVIYGKGIITWIEEKADSSFVVKNGCFFKPMERNSREIQTLYKLDFMVEYEDQAFEDQKVWYAEISSNPRFKPSDPDYTIGIYSPRRCEWNGWKMLDQCSSRKELKLCYCSKFFLHYEYKRKDGADYFDPDAPLVEEFEVSKAEFIDTLNKYRINNV